MGLKFIVDESTGIKVADLLKEKGHDVLSVSREMRGASDSEVLSRALNEGRIIVTNDKDFGKLALSYKPTGILLLRLKDERIQNKLNIVRRILERQAERLLGNMVVASEEKIRVRRL